MNHKRHSRHQWCHDCALCGITFLILAAPPITLSVLMLFFSVW